MRYYIEPRFEKKWWSRPVKVVWDLKENFEYWDDPSYGNGGGEYVKSVKTLHTFQTKEQAEDILEQLVEE